MNFPRAPLVGTEYEPALVAVGVGAFACGVLGNTFARLRGWMG